MTEIIIPTRHWDDLRVPSNEQRLASYEAKRELIGRDVREVCSDVQPANPHRWEVAA